MFLSQADVTRYVTRKSQRSSSCSAYWSWKEFENSQKANDVENRSIRDTRLLHSARDPVQTGARGEWRRVTTSALRLRSSCTLPDRTAEPN